MLYFLLLFAAFHSPLSSPLLSLSLPLPHRSKTIGVDLFKVTPTEENESKSNTITQCTVTAAAPHVQHRHNKSGINGIRKGDEKALR